MKNVTISLDDETHRRARIRAAELRTSLSALVKQYLEGMAAGDTVAPPRTGVSEMPSTFHAPLPSFKQAPRKLGLLKDQISIPEDFDHWSDEMLDTFEAPIEARTDRR